MNSVVLIPVFNHGAAVGGVVDAVLRQRLPCILVDDGSDPDCAAVLDGLWAQSPDQVSLVRLAANQGKGGAVMAGLREAARQGFSHALQIDADGQHDPDQIPLLLSHAKAHPAALICGCPVFDQSVPKGRLYGRYLTHAWVWINTLSLAIRDSMCGFRVYPLASTVPLVNSMPMPKRMSFDIDVVVRLYWRGLSVINVPTRVRYPVDGISHFHYLRDNVLIAQTHARLFFGMLRRLPSLLLRTLRRQ